MIFYFRYSFRSYVHNITFTGLKGTRRSAHTGSIKSGSRIGCLMRVCVTREWPLSLSVCGNCNPVTVEQRNVAGCKRRFLPPFATSTIRRKTSSPFPTDFPRNKARALACRCSFLDVFGTDSNTHLRSAFKRK